MYTLQLISSIREYEASGRRDDGERRGIGRREEGTTEGRGELRRRTGVGPAP